MTKLAINAPLIVILHSGERVPENLSTGFSNKQIRIMNVQPIFAEIIKLLQKKPDAFLFTNSIDLNYLKELRNQLGKKLLPAHFPVFSINRISEVIISQNIGPGSLEIHSFIDAETCLEKAEAYHLKKVTTATHLSWATFFMLATILYFSLRAAKLFIPIGAFEFQVESFKNNDSAEISLRLSGPISSIKDRLILLEKFTSSPDFFFLPYDLSTFLISRKNECQKYLLLTQELLQLPPLSGLKSFNEIQANLKSITQLKTLFPKKWESTEAWFFLSNNEIQNTQLYNEVIDFKMSFQKRYETYVQLELFSTDQSPKDFDPVPWLVQANIYIEESWPDLKSMALGTNLAEVLEMRLANYRNTEKIRHLKSSIQFLSPPRNSSLQDYFFETDDAKLAFETLEKNSPDWRNLQKQLTPLQKDIIESLAKTLKQKIYDLCRPLIYEILGDQKTWQISCNKLLTNPKIIRISKFLIPLEFYSSGFSPDPLNDLITFLKQDIHLIKTNKITLKIDEKIFALLPDSPVLKISFANNNGTNTEFNAPLLPEKVNPLQFSCILNLNTTYKLHQKVRAELSLIENYFLLWEKPLLEPFGWTVMKTPANLLLGNEVLNLGKKVELSFEPPLPLIPELLLTR